MILISIVPLVMLQYIVKLEYDTTTTTNNNINNNNNNNLP